MPLPDDPIRQTTSCSASVEIDPAQDLEVAERLVEALDPQGRRAGHRSSAAVTAAWRGPVAGDEPVGEPRERDRDDDEDERHGDVRREVERGRLDDLRLAEDLDDADVDTRTVSFWRPMKSLRSGGITRRTACGTMT